jgi:hypothetical protein
VAVLALRKKYLSTVEEYSNGRLEGHIEAMKAAGKWSAVDLREEQVYTQQTAGLVYTLTRAPVKHHDDDQ